MSIAKRALGVLCIAMMVSAPGPLRCYPAFAAPTSSSPMQAAKKTQGQKPQPVHSAAVKKVLDEAQTIMGTCAQAYDKENKTFDEHFYQGVLSKVEDKLRQAVQLAQQENVPLDQADAMYRLGDCFLYQKRYKDGIEAVQQSMYLRKSVNPVDTIEIGECYSKIAMLKNMGQFGKDTMIDDVRNSYEIFSKFMPADDQRLMFDVKMLAEYASSPEEAVQFRKQDVQISIKNYGEKSPLLVGSEYFVLAIELGNNGQLNEAIDTAQQAIDWCNKGGGYGAYSNYMQTTMDHWRRQLAGSEPAWNVVYHARYAGRNPRSKPLNPNPPTVMANAGMQPGGAPYVSPRHRPYRPPVQTNPSTPVSPVQPPIQAPVQPPVQSPVQPPVQAPTTEPVSPSVTKPSAIPHKRRKSEAPDSSGRRYYAGGKEVSKSVYDALGLSNEACDLLNEHKFEEARDKLLQAVELDPESSSAQANLGVALAKLGQRSEAIEHIKLAVQMEPDKASPLSMLASVYQSNGQLDESISAYKQYLSKFPNESDATLVKALIHDLAKVLSSQQEVIAHNPGVEKAQDYLAFCTANEKVRWKKNGGAVKVYIQSGSGVKNFKPGFDKVLRESFNDWVTGTGGVVSIKFVNSKSDADVDCMFTDNFGQVSSLAEGGETQMHFDSIGGFSHCSIVLLTAHATNTLPPSENELREVCLHEIGHSLGLTGHSPNANDIMYCSESEVETKRPQLTARDLATLKRLYS